MHPSQTSQASSAAPAKPKLVLITAEGPEAPSVAQNQIIGSEHPLTGSGGFCLTDR